MKVKKENYEFDTKNEHTRHEARLNGNTSLNFFHMQFLTQKYHLCEQCSACVLSVTQVCAASSRLIIDRIHFSDLTMDRSGWCSEAGHAH
jgi:predicted dithiol-disulfide oxidoreductase (DUF899 family)